jgi:hypothetical protein
VLSHSSACSFPTYLAMSGTSCMPP